MLEQNVFFGAYQINQMYKWVQVLLHSCNTTMLDNMEKVAMTEFGKIYSRVERGKWIIYSPIWVDMPVTKYDGKRKLKGRGVLG